MLAKTAKQPSREEDRVNITIHSHPVDSLRLGTEQVIKEAPPFRSVKRFQGLEQHLFGRVWLIQMAELLRVGHFNCLSARRLAMGTGP